MFVTVCVCVTVCLCLQETAVFLLEVMFSFIHPFPWLEDITANANVFLFLFVGSLCRVFLPLRSLFYHSRLNSNASRLVANLSGITFNIGFIVRGYFHVSPVLTTSTVMCTVFLCSSYVYRMFETIGCMELRTPFCSPLTLSDSMWAMAMTIVTVGYAPPPAPWQPVSCCVFCGCTAVYLRVGPFGQKFTTSVTEACSRRPGAAAFCLQGAAGELAAATSQAFECMHTLSCHRVEHLGTPRVSE